MTRQEIIKLITKDYPHYTNKELAEKHGLSIHQVKRIVMNEHLARRFKKDDAYKEKLRKIKLVRLSAEQERQRLEKSKEGLRKARRKWWRDILAGEKSYKWPVRQLTHTAHRYKTKLVAKNGYILTTDVCTLWYDDNTKRKLPDTVGPCEYTEEQITKAHHIHFERAQDE